MLFDTWNVKTRYMFSDGFASSRLHTFSNTEKYKVDFSGYVKFFIVSILLEMQRYTIGISLVMLHFFIISILIEMQRNTIGNSLVILHFSAGMEDALSILPSAQSSID